MSFVVVGEKLLVWLINSNVICANFLHSTVFQVFS